MNFSGASRVERGATFLRVLTLTDAADEPINLAADQFRMQVRESYSSAIVVELTTENGRIAVIDPSGGRLALQLTALETEVLPPGAYMYDLERVKDGDEEQVERLIEGAFVVQDEVTHG